MDDKFNQMVADHNGKPWEVEVPSALDQCFDLAFGWCDYLGIPRETIRHEFAVQIWKNPFDSTLQYFDYIPNTANGIPHKGDIVVFDGPVGHVSVATGIGNSNTFSSFDQNWDTPNFHDAQGHPICRTVIHDYKTVLGWLRVKSTATAPVPTPTMNDDQQRAWTNLLNYRQTNAQGPEGNVEGFVNRLVGEDRQWIASQTGLKLSEEALTKSHSEVIRMNDVISTLTNENKVLTDQLAVVPENYGLDTTSSFVKAVLAFLRQYFPAKSNP